MKNSLGKARLKPCRLGQLFGALAPEVRTLTKRLPQRLKPNQFQSTDGTDKSVPFPNPNGQEFSAAHQVFPGSFRTVQVEVGMHRLVPGHHVGPVLDVMISVDQRKHSVVHMSVFGAAGDIDEVEFHGLAVL